MLLLDEDIFFGAYITEVLAKAVARPSGVTVFSYCVEDPERYGVVEFRKGGRAISTEKKLTVLIERWQLCLPPTAHPSI